MTNEEMLAKLAALTSVEDAYALMKENGYSGTMEDFKALCGKAAEEIGSMDLDNLDTVAGGFGMQDIKDGFNNAWDATKSGFSKGLDWVKANPELTASIAGGVAVAAIGVTIGVKAMSNRNAKLAKQDAMNNSPFYEMEQRQYQFDMNHLDLRNYGGEPNE